jgi:transcriptional regulator with XRE-family HTH domain
MFSCCRVNARLRAFTSGINGIGSLAAKFASALGQLTARTDLQYLTMLPWKALFPTTMLMRGVAAWCPVCLSSWEQAGKPIYVPLLWTLEVVKFCPYHRHPLRLTCPHCGLAQPLIGQCSRVGFCTRCRRWLGVDSGKDDARRYSVVHQETPEWEVWVATQLTELIEAGFHNPPLLTTEHLTRLVRLGTELEGLSGFARILGVSTTALTQWRLGAKHPVLPVYLRLARVFQVTLTDLLSGKVSAEQRQALDLGGIPFWRTLHARRRPHFDNLKASEQIEQALSELPPRSLRGFAMRTGYHAATLRKHFPNQCMAIQERFREAQAASTKQRHAQKVVEFRQIAQQLHEESIHLCVNAVLKRMSRPKSLEYSIAREVLADVQREILANRKPARK